MTTLYKHTVFATLEWLNASKTKQSTYEWLNTPKEKNNIILTQQDTLIQPNASSQLHDINTQQYDWLYRQDAWNRLERLIAITREPRIF